jgi:triosephosphate isomerase
VQNVHWKQEGAFTGEVSPTMAAEVGATIAEIGHCERRALFGETDEIVRAKTEAALAANLTPLICVGDTKLENGAGAAAATIIRQAKIALAGLTLKDVARCVLAYEPVWSIGVGGTPADPAEVSKTLAELRGALTAAYGDTGSGLRVLYGGSVNLDNVRALAATPNVDGLFVGRAAWTAEGLVELITRANKVLAV